jgi:hypothetical protein
MEVGVIGISMKADARLFKVFVEVVVAFRGNVGRGGCEGGVRVEAQAGFGLDMFCILVVFNEIQDSFGGVGVVSRSLSDLSPIEPQ